MPPLKRRENKMFERFGMKFYLNIEVATIPEWARNVKTQQVNGKDQSTQDWELTGNKLETERVIFAQMQDDDLCQQPMNVEVLSTSDGPMLALTHTQASANSAYLDLVDPCIVQFDGKARINLMPIFGVTRTLRLAKSAIRARFPPTQLLVGIYPGFLIQNKMCKYELRANLPFAQSAELANDAS